MNRLPDDFRVETWGIGQGAPAAIRETEAGMEKLVSEYIGRMSLVYVGVEDDPGPSSDRAYIEKNAIGLLSGPSGPFDSASADWLGNYSPHPLIRASALWNVDYIARPYDPRFLDIMEEYMEVTLGRRLPPNSSIAPADWYTRKPDNLKQLTLFR